MLMHTGSSIVAGPLAFASRAGDVQPLQERFLGWNFPADYADLVLWHIALALIYLLLLTLSLVDIVIWIFSTSKSLRISNIVIPNLAMSDLLMATEMPMLIINSFLERTIGWETGCDVYALFGAISGMGQADRQRANAFDRYRTISCPIDGRLNGKQAMVFALFTWFGALLFSMLPTTGPWNRYEAVISNFSLNSFLIKLKLYLSFITTLYFRCFIRDGTVQKTIKSRITNQSFEVVRWCRLSIHPRLKSDLSIDGETLSYLETRSRAIQSPKRGGSPRRVERRKKKKKKKGEHSSRSEDSSGEYRGTFAFMCYLLV
ncbi:hypothetical protein PUN28_018038 [Cardiocondyla obscurior]|uniref:G-protein coupled receptors family 1 profile domain-containing protein n=1 Tax=Cardiocondyla obscurior TaxID=286306 RepID=A0AAW2EJQ1_9HYME